MVRSSVFLQRTKWLSGTLALWLLIGSAFVAQADETNKSPQPYKIMALAPNLVEILFELGVGHKIIGVSEHTDFPEKARQIPIVANYLGVQLERVIEKQPDLILVWHGTTPQNDINKLTSLGIKIETFYAESVPDLVTEITRMGQLIGTPQRAKQLASQIQQEYQQILSTRELTSGTESSTWPIGFIEIWPEPLTTAGSQTIVGMSIELCGLNNMYSEAGPQYPQASLEKVLTTQPDVIIQPVSFSNPTKTKDWSSYSFLNAVKKQAIISPNADALFRWGPRLTAEISALCADIQKVIKN